MTLPLATEAIAAQSLADIIKATDAKYLETKPINAAGDAPRIEAGGGEGAESNEAPKDQEIAQGDVRATLTYKERTSPEGEKALVPIVTIVAGGEQTATLEGLELPLNDPPVAVQIAEIDPANQTPEVVVSFYTGGAHCCSDTKVLTKAKDGSSWKTVEVGKFDGGPLLATDPVGDGRYVFETRDNAFLYTFSCYACSTAPLRILAVENAEVKDLSADPKYLPAHQRHLKAMIASVPDDDVNGFLAGYVGEKIRLGEGKEAWEIMLAHYDKASESGLKICDRPLDEAGTCPGSLKQLSFPDALERMLNENGYKIE
jgi:hypothetical protein